MNSQTKKRKKKELNRLSHLVLILFLMNVAWSIIFGIDLLYWLSFFFGIGLFFGAWIVNKENELK